MDGGRYAGRARTVTADGMRHSVDNVVGALHFEAIPRLHGGSIDVLPRMLNQIEASVSQGDDDTSDGKTRFERRDGRSKAATHVKGHPRDRLCLWNGRLLDQLQSQSFIVERNGEDVSWRGPSPDHQMVNHFGSNWRSRSKQSRRTQAERRQKRTARGTAESFATARLDRHETKTGPQMTINVISARLSPLRPVEMQLIGTSKAIARDNILHGICAGICKAGPLAGAGVPSTKSRAGMSVGKPLTHRAGKGLKAPSVLYSLRGYRVFLLAMISAHYLSLRVRWRKVSGLKAEPGTQTFHRLLCSHGMEPTMKGAPCSASR